MKIFGSYSHSEHWDGPIVSVSILTILSRLRSAHPNAQNGNLFQKFSWLGTRILNLNIDGTLENNGSLIGTESANITCGTFAGNENGLLKSPVITLIADVFAYKGTIECSGKCTIYVKEPFNEKMFKRKGKGEFEIVMTGCEHVEVSSSLGEKGLFIDCCLIH